MLAPRRLSPFLLAVVVTAVTAAAPRPLAAQIPPPASLACGDLFPSNPSDGPRAGDLFGCALSLDRGTAAIGSVLDDDRGEDAGAVFVLERGAAGFRQAAKLFAGDAAAGDELGFAVALDGDRLVAGAPLHDERGRSSGAAYVFHRGPEGWGEEAKLGDPGLGTLDELGYAVAIDGDTVAVGAPGDDDRAAGAGAVYVFRRGDEGWALAQKLTATDGAAGDGFGSSLALEGGLLLVGAPFDADAGAASGAVYVFAATDGGWSERQKLTASNSGPAALFGHAVALEGDLAAVGARLASRAGPRAGAAYVFRLQDGRFAEEARLEPEGLAPGDELGIAVAVDLSPDLGEGERVLVGARFDDQEAADSGAAYLFERRQGEWVETAKIKSEAPAVGDELGYALALTGGTVVAGIYRDDGRGPDAGAACLLETGPPETDLAVAKTVDRTSAAPGDTLRYTLTVTDRGSLAVAGARVRDEVPGSLGAVSWTCSASSGAACTAAGGGAIDDRVSLPPGGSVTYTIVARVASCGEGAIVNEASVAPPDGVVDRVPDNDRARVATPVEADLSVTLACSAGGTTGLSGACAYALVAANAGPCPVRVARLESAAPDGLGEVAWSCTPAGGAVCRPSGRGSIVDALTLPVGAAATYLVAGSPQAGFAGPLRPAATLAPPAGVVDPVPADNTATAACADCRGTVPGEASADVAVAVEPRVATGARVAFRLTVRNVGEVDADDVVLANPTPPGLVLLSATAPCEGGFPCSLGTVTAGAAPIVVDVFFGVDCASPPTPGEPVTDVATVTTTTAETDTANNQASATAPAPTAACTADLAIDKTAPQSTPSGSLLAYSVTVSNLGPEGVHGAVVTDPLPPSFAGAAWTCTASPGASCPASGTGGLEEEVDLPAAGAAVFNITGEVGLAPCGEILNEASVAPPPGIVDPVAANNADTVTTLVFPTSGLCGSKRLLPGPHGEGAPVTYEILVLNAGPGALADGPGDESVDILPDGLTLLAATADRGVVTTLGNTVHWNGSLAVGEAVRIVIQAMIDDGTDGQTICNQGLIVPVPDGLPTDDPSRPGTADPTCFEVVGVSVVPALSGPALVLLALLLAAAGGWCLRRGRA